MSPYITTYSAQLCSPFSGEKARNLASVNGLNSQAGNTLHQSKKKGFKI